ncbi:MAG: metallophosphoesterase, partial [Bacteroidales bacterium]|nr:metallophosphoesterase [Bacteroidales bacterium]
MLFFLIPLLADIWLWYALLTDLKKRNMVLRTIVLVVKATLTAALIYLVITIAAYRGEFAEPVNAYRQIVFGAITALNITAGSLYLIMVLLTWVPGRLLNRKLKAAGIVNITLFLLVVIIFADGYFRQRFDVRIVRDEVPVKDLDPALSGMKIVVIGDLHLSSWHRHYDRLEGVMAMVASEEPDLLVNTGDFVTFGWQEYGSSDTILRKAGNGS